MYPLRPKYPLNWEFLFPWAEVALSLLLTQPFYWRLWLCLDAQVGRSKALDLGQVLSPL